MGRKRRTRTRRRIKKKRRVSRGDSYGTRG
jgi:hypothetical protein